MSEGRFAAKGYGAEGNLLPRLRPVKGNFAAKATGWNRHLCLRLGLDKHGLQPLRSPISRGQPNDGILTDAPSPLSSRPKIERPEGDVRLSGGTPTLCPAPCCIRKFSPQVVDRRRPRLRHFESFDFQLPNYQITHLLNRNHPFTKSRSPKPEGRNSLARGRKPRVNGRKSMEPRRGDTLLASQDTPAIVQTRCADALRASVSRRFCTRKNRKNLRVEETAAISNDQRRRRVTRLAQHVLDGALRALRG